MMIRNVEIKIGSTKVGLDHPPYFIAEIGSNFDGDLQRAKDLIYLAKDSGAHAAKFQHYTAECLVSDEGFKSLGSMVSHQSGWKSSVYETYHKASLPREWTNELKETCDDAGIEFLTAPYSLELIDYISPYVSAIKIGSGEITYTQLLERAGKLGKPILLACGASSAEDVQRAVQALGTRGSDLILMQCNTNYLPGTENTRFLNLNVLDNFAEYFPNAVLGLSDHTGGFVGVLGAIAKGARVIEKHFTDSVDRQGPDHPFSMTPSTWKEMVSLSNEVFASLGDGVKKVEPNEVETVIVQRRGICAAQDLRPGQTLTTEDLTFLRPCPDEAFHPYQIDELLGRKISRPYARGELFKRGEFFSE
jgi:N-acetylneuraminate synthase